LSDTLSNQVIRAKEMVSDLLPASIIPFVH
jgi:hypothetical protein